MRCLLKNLAKTSLFIWLLAAASVQTALAAEILVTPPYLENSQLQLTTQFDLELTPEVIETLNAEIPVGFSIKILLTHKDSLFIFNYQTTQKEILIQRQLRYSVFEDSYFVEEGDKISNHFSLAQALEKLTSLEEYPLIPLTEIYLGLNYQIKARIKLDLWSLPAPLFTQALITKNWHLKSPWINEEVRINDE